VVRFSQHQYLTSGVCKGEVHIASGDDIKTMGNVPKQGLDFLPIPTRGGTIRDYGLKRTCKVHGSLLKRYLPADSVGLGWNESKRDHLCTYPVVAVPDHGGTRRQYMLNQSWLLTMDCIQWLITRPRWTRVRTTQDASLPRVDPMIHSYLRK
jgi:hypothetical protein